MGEALYCDMCGVNVAIKEALKPVVIDETKVAEGCLNCVQTLGAAIKAKKMEVEAARAAPPVAAEPEPAAVPEKEPAILGPVGELEEKPEKKAE